MAQLAQELNEIPASVATVVCEKCFDYIVLEKPAGFEDQSVLFATKEESLEKILYYHCGELLGLREKNQAVEIARSEELVPRAQELEIPED